MTLPVFGLFVTTTVVSPDSGDAGTVTQIVCPLPEAQEAAAAAPAADAPPSTNADAPATARPSSAANTRHWGLVVRTVGLTRYRSPPLRANGNRRSRYCEMS